MIYNTIYKDNKAPYFLATMLIFGIAAGLFNGVLNNYLHEVLHVSKLERGVVEMPREVPGLLLIVLISLLYRICEIRILRLAFLVSMVGMVGIIYVGDIRITAVLMIVLWSTGEHMMMPLRQAIAVHMAQPGKGGLALGAIRSVRNLGQLAGYYLIPLVFIVFPMRGIVKGSFPYFRFFFLITLIILLFGLGTSLGIGKSDRHIQRRRLYFHKKYRKYYILELFFGARKQIFFTFAPYVLIIRYGIQTEMLALLYGIASTANIFIAPLVGRGIDRFGYRIIIIIDTILLILLCGLYGYAHRILPYSAAYITVGIVFVIDSILFVVTMARTMYVKSISSSKEEVMATLSTGISINHLISILIAILGGVLWAKLGIEVLFSIAALFGFGSFLFSMTLPKDRIHNKPPIRA